MEVKIGSLSHYLQSFNTFQVVRAGFLNHQRVGRTCPKNAPPPNGGPLCPWNIGWKFVTWSAKLMLGDEFSSSSSYFTQKNGSRKFVCLFVRNQSEKVETNNG